MKPLIHNLENGWSAAKIISTDTQRQIIITHFIFLESEDRYEINCSLTPLRFIRHSVCVLFIHTLT